MKVQDIKLEFANNTNLVFFPGQQVLGTVKFQVNEAIEVKGVILKFKGKAKVSWSEGTGDDRRHYSASEKYFSNEMNLVGKNRKHGDCENVILHAGDHHYPFQFLLPPTLPSSFEVSHGSVRYFVKLKIDRPSWHKDYKLTTPFTVLSQLDLNLEEAAMRPNQMNESKMICCLCCATGPVTAEFRIERSGYVPGEGVRVFAEIKNESDRTILKSKVKLYQKTTLKASGGHKNRRTTDLAKIERGKIEGGGSDRWTGEMLIIPPCPPSYLRGCSIIDIDHWLTFTADIEDTPFDLDLELPVIIGTIPLRNLYTVPQYGGFAPPVGFQDQAAPIESKDIVLQPVGEVYPPPPPITSQPGALPTAPPPSYTESMFSGNYINKTEDDTQENQFKPYYTYYNFGTQPN